jgi:hypothetical protein
MSENSLHKTDKVVVHRNIEEDEENCIICLQKINDRFVI